MQCFVEILPVPYEGKCLVMEKVDTDAGEAISVLDFATQARQKVTPLELGSNGIKLLLEVLIQPKLRN